MARRTNGGGLNRFGIISLFRRSAALRQHL
jgi:hypothetical protein